MYRVEWKEEALRSLAKIGRIGDKIKTRVEKNLAQNPIEFGKPLERWPKIMELSLLW